MKDTEKRTSVVTEEAQANLTTNPLEGDDLLLERVFGGPAK